MPDNSFDASIRWAVRVAPIHAVIVALVFWTSNVASHAQDWVTVSVTSNNWLSLACSADGTRLLAGSQAFDNPLGSIYRSTNSGATWEPTSAPSQFWASISCSADAMKAVATGNGGVYLSKDFGASWTLATDSGVHGRYVASSADGAKLVVVNEEFMPGYGVIYCSTNSGSTWTQSVSGYAFGPWQAVASSGDGTTFTVAGWFGYQSVFGRLSVSTNSGLSWWQANLPEDVPWQCVTISADGTRLVAGGASYYGEPSIYFSADKGMTWQPATSPLVSWSRMVSSADGLKLAALGGQPAVYASDDGAASWGLASAPVAGWTSIACSADGERVFASAVDAVSRRGLIYLNQKIPAPVLHLVGSDTGHNISWTVPSRSFGLQQSPSLIKAEWTAVLASPILNNTNLQFEVTVPKQIGSMFYRLISL